MKKTNKGFTIVELVIVIAVIAILAAVLIPTFGGVVNKANASAALQEATSTMKSTLAMSDYGTLQDGTIFVIDSYDNKGFKFKYTGNSIKADETASVVFDANTMNSIIIYQGEGNNTLVDVGADEAHKVFNTTTGKTVNDIIQAALSLVPAPVLNVASGETYAYTINAPDGDDTDTDPDVWYVFTNSDYAKDVVTFTYSKI